MPLTLANIGERNTIKKVSGSSAQKQRLNELGFVPGAAVEVVSKIRGNVIVMIKNSRVAIAKDAAMKIMI